MISYIVVLWQTGATPLEDVRVKMKMVPTMEKAEKIKKRWEEEYDPTHYVRIYCKNE